ncbi:unnamed protein product, partial [Brachionus calyciflorus]
MSKRPSTDLNSTKSNKRVKRTLETTTSSFDTTTDTTEDSEHFIEFNEEDLKELKSKTNKILEKTPNDQKVTELTNLFKEILNTTSTQDRNKLGGLFTILLEYLSSNSKKIDDKLVSQISFLLSLQIDSLPPIILKNSIDLFVSQIKSQKSFNE